MVWCRFSLKPIHWLVTTGDPLKTSPGGSRFRARRCRARWRSISSSSGSTLAENVGNVDHIKVTGNHTYVIHGLLYHLLWQANLMIFEWIYIYILCIYIYCVYILYIHIYGDMYMCTIECLHRHKVSIVCVYVCIYIEREREKKKRPTLLSCQLEEWVIWIKGN